MAQQVEVDAVAPRALKVGKQKPDFLNMKVPEVGHLFHSDAADLRVFLRAEKKTIINGEVIKKPGLTVKFSGNAFRTTDEKLAEDLRAHRNFGKIFHDVRDLVAEAKGKKLNRAVAALEDPEVEAAVVNRLREKRNLKMATQGQNVVAGARLEEDEKESVEVPAE